MGARMTPAQTAREQVEWAQIGWAEAMQEVERAAQHDPRLRPLARQVRAIWQDGSRLCGLVDTLAKQDRARRE